MSSLQLAAVGVEPLDVLLGGYPGALLPQLRHRVEHVCDARTLPRLQSPMGMDVVSALQPVVAARQLVRTDASSELNDPEWRLAPTGRSRRTGPYFALTRSTES